MHPSAEDTALGAYLMADTTYLATREVGFSGLEILRGLERLVARLS